jgi:hypothetical protein
MPLEFSELFADNELPMAILPVEGFPKYAEFWGPMGAVHPWKPAIYLQVTIPVALPAIEAGRMVTTRIIRMGPTSEPDEIAGQKVLAAGEFTQVAGTVWSPDGSPLPEASVFLETEGGRAIGSDRTDSEGRFGFARLSSGAYRLRVRAPGMPEREMPIVVPAEDGTYDVQL